ncbi:MAG: hypothetical protein ABI885_28705, partial [Gammaproteobacteria bacterium]
MKLRTRAGLAALMLGASTAAPAGTNTWTQVGPQGGDVLKVIYNRDTPTTVYLMAEGGFFRSLDSGDTWHLFKDDFLNAQSDMDVDPSDPNRLYIVSGSQQTLQVSTDAGATFSPITSFPNVGNIWQLEVSTDGQTLYAASASRVFRSDDRGGTWQERTAVGASPGLVNRLLVDPTDKNTVYAVATASSSTNALFVTHDGAASWTQLAGATAAAYIFDIAISAANPARIWVAGAQGVYVSTDSGQNFLLKLVPASSGAAHALGGLIAFRHYA